MKKILSERGKELIVFNNFTFRLVSKLQSTNEERWRCTKKKCSATLYTLDDGNTFSRTEKEHDHAALEDPVLCRRTVRNAVKRKAQDDISERPSKLIHKEIQHQKGADEFLTRKDIKLIRDCITDERLRKYPKLPKCTLEVQVALDVLDIKTSRDEPFLLRNDRAKQISIFCCQTNLNYLCESDVILMDGTFEYSPKFFTQLFTIHGYLNDSYIPLVYCLLPDKKKESYISAMRMIQEECSRRQLELTPKSVVIDFEEGIHGAVTTIFPEAVLVGCRFHLGQAWWRKIQKLGLATDYKEDDSEVGKWLRYCFGLTYLHPGQVRDAFCFLMSIQPENQKLVSFSDYLVETYISESDANFPPLIWALNSSDLWRTTNACESFHSKFKKSCPSPHPNIFVFLDTLKETQIDTYIGMNTANTGRPTQRRKKTRMHQQFIERKLLQLKNGEIDILNFLKCVSVKAYIC